MEPLGHIQSVCPAFSPLGGLLVGQSPGCPPEFIWWQEFDSCRQFFKTHSEQLLRCIALFTAVSKVVSCSMVGIHECKFSNSERPLKIYTHTWLCKNIDAQQILEENQNKDVRIDFKNLKKLEFFFTCPSENFYMSYFLLRAALQVQCPNACFRPAG